MVRSPRCVQRIDVGSSIYPLVVMLSTCGARRATLLPHGPRGFPRWEVAFSRHNKSYIQQFDFRLFCLKSIRERIQLREFPREVVGNRLTLLILKLTYNRNFYTQVITTLWYVEMDWMSSSSLVYLYVNLHHDCGNVINSVILGWYMYVLKWCHVNLCTTLLE